MTISKPPGEMLFVTDQARDLTSEEEDLFDLPARAFAGGKVRAQDLWLEVEIGEGWRAAFRLVPYADGQPVVAEVRIFPADSWPNRQPGTWRAHALGVRCRQFEAKLDERRLPKGARFPKIGQGVTGQLLRKPPLLTVRRIGREFVRLLGELGDWTRDPRSITAPGSNIDPLAIIREVDEVAPELGGDKAMVLTFAGFRGTPRSQPKRRADAWDDDRVARLSAAYIDRVEAGSRKPVADVAPRFHLSPSQVRDALNRARTKLGIMTPPTAQGRAGGQLTAYGKSLLREKPAKKKPKKQARRRR